MTRAYNFGAGPAVLPVEALEYAQRELLDFNGSGMSVLECSHRGKDYEAIHNEAIAGIKPLLETMQCELLERAHLLRVKRSRVINSLAEFEQFFKDGGGFAWVHWAGTHEQEEEMAKRFETSIRCIPLPDQIPAEAQGAGTCILTGQPSNQRVVMARAY